VAIPMADLGHNPSSPQPVATPVGLIGIFNGVKNLPFVFAESGNDIRELQTNGFKIYGFEDDGSDVDNSPGVQGPTSDPDVFQWDQAVMRFDQLFQPNFRGTIQPATAFSDTGLGRVFFAGTRFNPPGSQFAPPVPPFPCASSFDSIVYVLGAQTGAAAYNLNNSGSNSFRIFNNSRLTGVEIIGDPNTGGTQVSLDEGLLGASPVPKVPPPPPGVTPGGGNGIPDVLSASAITPSSACPQ
jgi:hypothetical protein